MNAIEFVKKYGVEESAKIANESVEFGKNVFYDLGDGLYYGSDFGGRICVNDLKQIVDAFELVEKDFGSVEIAEYEHMVSGCYSDPYWIEVRKAINLVEKCKK